jgi:hypothetical protein
VHRRRWRLRRGRGGRVARCSLRRFRGC